MKIGIGIVTYNTPQTDLNRWSISLLNAISKISNANHADASFKIFTIDNSNKKVSLWASKEVKTVYLPSQGNIGYTKGINLLIDKAINEESCDYFLTANPDGVFHPDFFKNILMFAKRFKNSVIESSQFPEEHLKQYNKKTFETSWASGCCTLYPAKIFKQIGLMDENFFMYVEDVDFSWRARMAGFKVRICPIAKYGHPTLTRPHSIKLDQFMLESGRYFAHKWGNKDFLEFCEKELLSRKIYQKKSQFPKLPKTDSMFKSKNSQKISNFKNFFYFAEPRW